MVESTDSFSTARRLLAVDDERSVLTLVRRSLELEGFEVATAESGAEALDWIGRHGLPHLAIVDVKMPRMDGLEFSRRVQEYSDLPVILLTAVNGEADVARAIEEVAEDYVVKPFSPKVLAARVKRVLQRIGDFSYAFGPVTVIDDRLSIDIAHQKMVVRDQTIPLTPTEAKILHILVRSAPRTIATDYLLRRVWPLEEIFEDALRVHIHRIRKKIEVDSRHPKYVLTHRGWGYSFAPIGP